MTPTFLAVAAGVYAVDMKGRTLALWSAWLRRAASLALALPVFAGVWFASSSRGFSLHDGHGLVFLAGDSCFPARPTVSQLVDVLIHRRVYRPPAESVRMPDPLPAWTRRPDGRIVI